MHIGSSLCAGRGVNLRKIELDFTQQGWDFTMLDSTGEASGFEDNVRDIAATNTTAGAQARNILEFVFGEEQILPWEERDDTSSKRDMLEVAAQEKQQEKLITAVYPNPANSSITIEYNWDGDEPIVVEFFDLLGSKATKIILRKGTTEAVLDISQLPSGTYIYRTISNSPSNQSGKIVILR